MSRAVEVRAKMRALLVDCPPRREAEDLVAAAVGEDGLGPANERVKAAAARDQIVAGTQIEVIRVAEQNLDAEVLEVAMRDGLHRALRADGHERRRLDFAVRRRHHASSRAAVGVCHLKTERHVLSLTTVNTRRAR